MYSTPTNESPIHDNDVLLGRGGATNNHVGNKRFRAIVAKHQEEYLNAKKKDKGTIARSIVRFIREEGGRFLRKQEGADDVWVEVDNKRATEKTSQALREGLDVRHKEFRKNPRRDSDSLGEAPAKRRKTVKGKVLASNDQSPALISESEIPNAVPDMVPTRLPMPYMFYQPAPISTEDVDNVESV